jgi:hypothetical protein
VTIEALSRAAPPVPSSTRSTAQHTDADVIERMFGRLKSWKRIATRYDRLAVNYLAAIALVATIAQWLGCWNSRAKGREVVHDHAPPNCRNRDPALDDEARAFIHPSPAYGASEAPRARVQKRIGM